MASKPQITWEPTDVARLQGAIAAMRTITGKSIKACVQHVTGTMCWGLIHATPNARKMRRVVRAPAGVTVDWQRQRRSSKPAPQADWAVEIYYQNVGKSYLGYGSREGAMRSNAREIKMRGLADATWRRAYAKAKARGGEAERIDKGPGVAAGANRFSQGALRAPSLDYAESEIANQLPYVVVLDRGGPHTPAHHIMAHGAHKARKRQEWILRTLAKRYGEAWQSGGRMANAAV